jgi:hypothetical protein
MLELWTKANSSVSRFPCWRPRLPVLVVVADRHTKHVASAMKLVKPWRQNSHRDFWKTGLIRSQFVVEQTDLGSVGRPRWALANFLVSIEMHRSRDAIVQ